MPWEERHFKVRVVAGLILTTALQALPEAEKIVRFAYKTSSGRIVPPAAKAVWPLPCEAK